MTTTETLFEDSEIEAIAVVAPRTILNVALIEIDTFNNHPFQVRDDDEMKSLVIKYQRAWCIVICYCPQEKRR